MVRLWEEDSGDGFGIELEKVVASKKVVEMVLPVRACLVGLYLDSGSSSSGEALQNVLQEKLFFNEKQRSWSRFEGAIQNGSGSSGGAPHREHCQTHP